MSQIKLVLALVPVPALPPKLAISVLHVVHVLTVIHIVFRSFLPFTYSMLQSVFKLARICVAIYPLILAHAVWIAPLVLAYVNITVFKHI